MEAARRYHRIKDQMHIVLQFSAEYVAFITERCLDGNAAIIFSRIAPYEGNEMNENTRMLAGTYGNVWSMQMIVVSKRPTRKTVMCGMRSRCEKGTL